MCLTLTTIVGIDPRFEFGGTEQPVWFRDGPLPMDPFWFNGVEPRTFAGQMADDDTQAHGSLLDLLIVLTRPGPHGLAACRRGIGPDQQQGREPARRKLGRAPREEVDRDGTHRTSRDKPQPHLIALLRPWPQQQAIT